MTTPHEMVNPADLPKAVGFSHVVIATTGRHVFLAGQSGHHADGSIPPDLVAQFGQACNNVATALAAAGGLPEHVVNLSIYVTDVDAYRNSLAEIGPLYRQVFGHHYPAMALLEVTGLFDPRATVELVATAVIP